MNDSQTTQTTAADAEAYLRLGPRFRRMSVFDRRVRLADFLDIDEQELSATGFDTEMCELADIMVESSVGYVPVPLGIAAGFLIDGSVVNVPLAVEEPSVVAAATYAASIVSRQGGFVTTTTDPVMTAEIYLKRDSIPDSSTTADLEQEVGVALTDPLAGMTARGGGFRGIDIDRVAPDLIAVRLHIDTRDAMGANILNTSAEHVRPLLERRLDATSIMAILTNASDQRLATATFSIPVDSCARSGRSGQEVAQRVVTANRIANSDPHRAITHNKGIMNGISSLALATGNDTRAIEAACHAYAVRDGQYRSLTEYEVRDGRLNGTLTLPVALGTVGGAVGFHPAARFAIKVLGNPSATRLAAIAVSVGLGQNFAALSALVSEGIQAGHMRLHANRLAWQAGARGDEIAEVADYLSEGSVFNSRAAAHALEVVRRHQSG